MKYSQAKRMFSVGDLVCIKDNGLEETDRCYTATEEMHNMVGNVYTLVGMKEASKFKDTVVMVAGGFSWAADDMYVVKHANPGKLVNDSGQEGVLMFDPSTI